MIQFIFKNEVSKKVFIDFRSWPPLFADKIILER